MELSKMSDAELLQMIGLACEPEEFYSAVIEEKDIKAQAVVELGKRAYAKKIETKTITCPEDAVRLCADMRDLDHEEVRVICLNQRNVVLKIITVFKGTTEFTLMGPREIFREALKTGATKIIVIHNHPSGDSTPSKEDIKIIQNLKNAGKLVGIAVVDSIVLGRFAHYSLQTKGHL